MTDLARRESEILLYTAPDGAVKVGVLFRDETVCGSRSDRSPSCSGSGGLRSTNT